MKIAHFSTYTKGGAAVAAMRLHQGLKLLDVESRFYHRGDEVCDDDASCDSIEFRKLTSNPLVRPIALNLQRFKHRKARQHYRDHLASRPSGFEVFSPAQLFQPTSFDYWRLGADIINLHWVAHYLDYASFFSSIPRHIPIVWTLHDMNAFTGGCHYAGVCRNFEMSCGNCPQVARPNPKDVSRESFRLKQRALRGRPVFVVAPSQWLCDLARKSEVFPDTTRFQIIQYGLDTESFQPVPKKIAKRHLGLSTNKATIMFGAEEISNHRKGFSFLWQALKRLGTTQHVECAVFGNGETPVPTEEMPKIKNLGFLKSDEQKSLAYSAADMFVMPSLQDNQPQTGLEAMACKTPVVAFESGGIPEYVIHGITGSLAKTGDVKDLAHQIDQLVLKESHRRQLGEQAQTMITQQFNLKRQASEYMSVYQFAIRQNALRKSSKSSAA